MQDSDDNAGDVDETWEEPHVPTLTGIGIAAPVSTRGVGTANDPEQLSDAEMTPAQRERRKKKKQAQQKALEEKRAFAAAQQKKKVPAAEKAKARGKSLPPPPDTDEPSPASSVRPSASKRPPAPVLASSDLKKLETEEKLRSQTKMLFAFAALVVALIAVGFYLH